jgi:hypothetical protein
VSWLPTKEPSGSLDHSSQKACELASGLQFHHFGAEKFTTDIQSPLMVHTVTKAAATTTAAVSSIRQVPGPLRPAITTAHTIALGGYLITFGAWQISTRLLLRWPR